MAAQFETTPLSEEAGIIVSGINAAEPLDDGTRKALYDLYLDAGLILLRDQHLTPEQHIAFSREFGELDPHPAKQLRLDGHPEIMELSNRNMGGTPEKKEDELIGQIPWHSDLTYTVRPSRGALLLAREIPEEGGETGFIDIAAVYDRLSEEMKKRIEGLEVLHNAREVKQPAVKTEPESSGKEAEKHKAQQSGQVYSFGEKSEYPNFPDVIQPLVVTHPESGRKSLNVSPLFARRILGLPEEEARELLRELISHATSRRFVHIHKWRVGDIIIWDNWRTMHMATGYKAKYLRVVHRATLRGNYQTGRVAA